MKMRASLATVMMLSTAAVCVAAIAILFAFHSGKTAARNAIAEKSLPAASETVKPASSKVDPKWAEAYGKLPMGFEENKGQTSSDVRFLSHGQGYELFLTPQEAVLELRRSKPADRSPMKRAAALKVLRAGKYKAKTSIVRIRMVGANPNPEIAGLNRLPGTTNYFIGSDSKNWRTDVPSYARVKYSGIYPGVDLVFYGNQRRLEYDYVVAPGVDPKAIALDVAGARKLRIDARGNLVMIVPGGKVELQKPVVYQEANGQRQEVAANYVLSGDHRVNFSVADYDRSKPLVFDPVLNYSTYLGGSASGDEANGIVIDSAGDAYVAGQTFSSTFPTTSANAFQSAPLGGIANGAVFLTELNPTGTAEIYSTYLAGSGGEYALGIAIDTSSPANVYVTGSTFSIDYPTTANAYIPGPLGTNPNGSAFISKINTTLSGTSSLVYSSFVGGTNGDIGAAIAADSNQNAYITGVTYSTGINTATGFQLTGKDTLDGNAFLTRIDTTQSGAASLIYSTYLGGSGANAGSGNGLGEADEGFGISVASNKAYVVGTTASTDFPVTTASAYQTAPMAGNVTDAAFVSEIDTTQSGAASLVYSTYLSGELFDVGYAIALGQNGVAYVTGATQSLQFPTTSGAFQTTGNSDGVAYVSLIDTTKSGSSSLKYSTYLGGNNGDTGQGIQVDSAGNAYVAGATDSIVSAPYFPLTPGALQTTSTNTQGVAFITEISPNGNGAADLVYSTLFGGGGDNATPDRAFGIAIDSSTPVDAYIAGETASTDFPVYPNPGAFQTSLTGSDTLTTTSAFVAKLTLQPTVAVSPTTLSFGIVLMGTTSLPQTVTLTNNTGTVVPYTLSIQGTNPVDFAAVPGGPTPCGATLSASPTACTISVTFTPSTAAAESASLIVGYTPYGITSSQTVLLTGNIANNSFTMSPSTITFPAQVVGTASAPSTITLSNSSNAALPFTTSLSDAPDFTVQPGGTTPCSTSAGIPANGSCTYNATFNPAGGDFGALVGTFLVTAGGNTLTTTLNGTSWDFPGFAVSQSTVTTAPGATITPAPTVTANFVGGVGGGSVALSCTGSIPLGSCSISPASISAAAPVATILITTTGSSMAPPSSLRFPPISRRQIVLIGLTVLMLLSLPFARRRRAKLGLLGALVMIVGLAACSGSSGTPAGSYTLTITGTANGVTRTATITLNVT